MFPIVEAEFLAPDVKRFVIEAPRVAKKRKAGQFVIVRLHAHGVERTGHALKIGKDNESEKTAVALAK
jgi:NAD(P)H-flavin reductase